MASSLDKLRDLAGKNAALSQHANHVQQNIHAAAEQESARLSTLIEGVSQTGVLTDDSQAEAYQSWVMQRAALLRLLAQDAPSWS